MAVTILQEADYTPSTDIIQPRLGTKPLRTPWDIEAVDEMEGGFETIKPLVGWAPFTHLIRAREGASYYLAKIATE